MIFIVWLTSHLVKVVNTILIRNKVRYWIEPSCQARTYCFGKYWTSYIYGQRHAKMSLMSWVVVIPKEGWARVAAPSLLLVSKKKKKKAIFFRRYWVENYDIIILCTNTIFRLNLWSSGAVGVIPKEGRARRPSFGMTTTQDIRDLFAWRILDMSSLWQSHIMTFWHNAELNAIKKSAVFYFNIVMWTIWRFNGRDIGSDYKITCWLVDSLELDQDIGCVTRKGP